LHGQGREGSPVWGMRRVTARADHGDEPMPLPPAISRRLAGAARHTPRRPLRGLAGAARRTPRRALHAGAGAVLGRGASARTRRRLLAAIERPLVAVEVDAA